MLVGIFRESIGWICTDRQIAEKMSLVGTNLGTWKDLLYRLVIYLWKGRSVHRNLMVLSGFPDNQTTMPVIVAVSDRNISNFCWQYECRAAYELLVHRITTSVRVRITTKRSTFLLFLNEEFQLNSLQDEIWCFATLWNSFSVFVNFKFHFPSVYPLASSNLSRSRSYEIKEIDQKFLHYFPMVAG